MAGLLGQGDLFNGSGRMNHSGAGVIYAASSILPEVFEPVRSQFCVARRVLDVAVSQIMLNGSCILSVIGELVAGSVAQHMWVDGERQSGLLAGADNDLTHSVGCQRCFALADKHIGRVGVLPLQVTQDTQLHSA